MALTDERIFYKPLHYPWAYEAWLTQQKLHWLPYEVPMADDVKDWRSSISPRARNLLTHTLRFFTQSDIEVNTCYMQEYTKIFKAPEVARMLTSFSNMETIHVEGYATLIETLGFPESEHQIFYSIKEMKAKYQFLKTFNCNTLYNTAKTLAIYGAFTEGVLLFSSFAILLNPQRFGRLRGVGQIVAWSARDETLHTNAIIQLFHTFVEENASYINKKILHEDIIECCRQAIALEDNFLDLVYEQGGVQGLKKSEVKKYIRYTVNHRLAQLRIPARSFRYKEIKHNPLPWMDEILNGQEFTNFFENRATEYARSATQGEWEDAFS